MKTVLVIGASKYGAHLAKYLCEMGNEVMLVDNDEDKISQNSHLVTSAEIGDYTLKSNLQGLGIDDYDYVFVCVGNFQNSLVIVDYLKELGAGYIVAKASSEIHEKFLYKSGADKVVYPERDTAYKSAVEFSNGKIFDFIKLDDENGIYEIEAPDKWCGKSLASLNVRKLHGVNIIASKSGDKVTPIGSPDYMFNKQEHIYVIGENKNIRALTREW